MAGERAYALKQGAVLLERALHSYALDVLMDQDFTVISVPSLVTEMPLVGTGQFPGHREETYAIPADDLYLADFGVAGDQKELVALRGPDAGCGFGDAGGGTEDEDLLFRAGA